MKKYFFDLATPKGCLYDYRGHAVAELKEAERMAELLALDLEATAAFDWSGTAVKVRDVFGGTLVSILVSDADCVSV
jgi:hypothetical protein